MIPEVCNLPISQYHPLIEFVRLLVKAFINKYIYWGYPHNLVEKYKDFSNHKYF